MAKIDLGSSRVEQNTGMLNFLSTWMSWNLFIYEEFWHLLNATQIASALIFYPFYCVTNYQGKKKTNKKKGIFTSTFYFSGVLF